MPFSSRQTQSEDIRAYVAELQLHMTLQAKNLMPSLNPYDSRGKLLHDSQAQLEKLASRQNF